MNDTVRHQSNMHATRLRQPSSTTYFLVVRSVLGLARARKPILFLENTSILSEYYLRALANVIPTRHSVQQSMILMSTSVRVGVREREEMLSLATGVS